MLSKPVALTFVHFVARRVADFDGNDRRKWAVWQAELPNLVTGRAPRSSNRAEFLVDLFICLGGFSLVVAQESAEELVADDLTDRCIKFGCRIAVDAGES